MAWSHDKFQGSAGAYGWYNCNVPRSTMLGFLNSVALQDPSFVLYTGKLPIITAQCLHSKVPFDSYESIFL